MSMNFVANLRGLQGPQGPQGPAVQDSGLRDVSDGFRNGAEGTALFRRIGDWVWLQVIFTGGNPTQNTNVKFQVAGHGRVNTSVHVFDTTREIQIIGTANIDIWRQSSIELNIPYTFLFPTLRGWDALPGTPV